MDINVLNQLTAATEEFDKLGIYDPAELQEKHAEIILAALKDGLEGDLSEIDWKGLLGQNGYVITSLVNHLPTLELKNSVIQAIKCSWSPTESGWEILREDHATALFYEFLKKLEYPIMKQSSSEKSEVFTPQKVSDSKERPTPPCKFKLHSNRGPAQKEPHTFNPKLEYKKFIKENPEKVEGFIDAVVNDYSYIKNDTFQVKAFARVITGLDITCKGQKPKLLDITKPKDASIKAMAYFISCGLVDNNVKDIRDLFEFQRADVHYKDSSLGSLSRDASDDFKKLVKECFGDCEGFCTPEERSQKREKSQSKQI